MPYEFTDQYDRVFNDYYIDPPFCSELLFDKIRFYGVIHDPACGSGNIVSSAVNSFYSVTYSDIMDRGSSRITPLVDYLKDETIRDNIVTNPPYYLCEEFFHHAWKHTKYAVALLLTRLAFLEGQKRNKSIFTPFPPTCVLVFSTRPSMPPPNVTEGGGKTAYCWIIWNKISGSISTELSWLIR